MLLKRAASAMGKTSKSSDARRLRAIVVAVCMLVALLVYADAQSSSADSTGRRGPHVSVDRTARAAAAEAAITSTNVATELEEALGTSFGGVWFEPATAKLHVGVTSVASREAAEAVAIGA